MVWLLWELFLKARKAIGERPRCGRRGDFHLPAPVRGRLSIALRTFRKSLLSRKTKSR